MTRSYFRSAANRINEFRQFLDNGSADSQKFTVKGFISPSVTYYTFLLLDPELGAQVGLQSPMRYADG